MKIKNFYKALIALVLTLCLAFSLTACGGGGEIEVKSVTLDRAGLALDIGGEATLSALVMPAEAASKVTWLSSDPAVATVNGGKVKGIGEGTAIIRAMAGGKYDDCTVTVTDPSKADVSATGISLNKQKLTMSVGDKETLQATISPVNATDKTVTWTSTMPSVATVDESGEITALAAGKTVIKATTHNNYTAICNVTVSGDSGNTPTTGSLYVKKVDSLSTRTTDFVMGMDASAVPAIEAAHGDTDGTHTYKNFKGEYEDVYKILKDNGITDIRIRVWNDPYDAEGNSYGGGNCNVANAVAIAQRCQAVGLGVIIDFHYSDFWADPGRQNLPKAWKGYNTTQIASAIYDFTKESLEKIQKTGVTISMVQVGNEITTGIAGTYKWADSTATICNYISKGAKAVRDVTGAVKDGGAKVVVHFTNPNSQDYVGFASYLNQYNVDYDVFGSSYYSVWHGTLSNLSGKLEAVHNAYGKEVMVMETSYAFTFEDADGCGNTAFSMQGYPATIQGQANSVRDVIETVADLGDYGLGVCYWEGTWISASESNNGTANRELCAQYGCGWASSNAMGYDSKVDGDGGCTEDNRTFWLSDGTVLESLKVFNLVKDGQTVSLKADYLYDQEDSYTVNEGPIVLPNTVDVILNTGATMSLTAYWEATDEDLAHHISTVGEYTIEGTTDFGGTCYFKLDVHNFNLCPNGSFEDCTTKSGENTVQSTGLAGWNFDYTKADGSVLQLYASNESNNAKLGTNSIHFSDQATVQFKVYQTLNASVWSAYGAGTYGVSFDIQGGNGLEKTMNIHAYVKVTHSDGTTETFDGNNVPLVEWRVWNRSFVSVDIDSTVTSVEVGMYVYAEQSNASAWPWGNIDNAQFYFIG